MLGGDRGALEAAHRAAAAPGTGRAKVAFQDVLGLKKLIAARHDDPARFYKAEYRKVETGAYQ